MQTETLSEERRRAGCGHEPTLIELVIGGDLFTLRSCSWCDWTEWVTADEPVDLTTVLNRIAASR